MTVRIWSTLKETNLYDVVYRAFGTSNGEMFKLNGLRFDVDGPCSNQHFKGFNSRLLYVDPCNESVGEKLLSKVINVVPGIKKVEILDPEIDELEKDFIDVNRLNINTLNDLYKVKYNKDLITDVRVID